MFQYQTSICSNIKHIIFMTKVKFIKTPLAEESLAI